MNWFRRLFRSRAAAPDKAPGAQPRWQVCVTFLDEKQSYYRIVEGGTKEDAEEEARAFVCQVVMETGEMKYAQYGVRLLP